jgi:hypothetical protein
MEAISLARIVDKLFLNYPCYIFEYVGDNDSSKRRYYDTPGKMENMQVGEKQEVPCYQNGQKKQTTDTYQ